MSPQTPLGCFATCTESKKKEEFDRIVSGELTQLLSALLPTDVSKSLRYVVGRYSHEKSNLVWWQTKLFFVQALSMRALFLKISKDNRPFPHYAPVSKHKEMITVFCPPKARVGAFVYRNAGKVY